MKIFSFSILLMILIFQSSFTQLIYPPYCYNQIQNCTTWQYGGVMSLTILDLDCPIKYSYWYRDCANPNPTCNYPIRQIFIEYYFIDEEDPACLELLQRNYPQWPTTDFVDLQWLANVYKDGYRALTFEKFKTDFEALGWDEQEPFLCNENPCQPKECSPAEYHFSLAACAYVCAVAATINGHDGTSYYVNYCNPYNDECCNIVRKYCFCQSTNQYAYFEDFEQIRNINCGDTPENVQCNGRIFDCYLSCQE